MAAVRCACSGIAQQILAIRLNELDLKYTSIISSIAFEVLLSKQFYVLSQSTYAFTQAY